MLLNDMHNNWDPADSDIRPAIATLHTDGNGHWTRLVLSVRITELSLGYINEEGNFAELFVHFNTDDWRCDKMGLIYTDKLFKKELQEFATSIGLAGDDIEYSEQGMQLDNAVSCDVGAKFMASWKAKYPEQFKAQFEEMYAE